MKKFTLILMAVAMLIISESTCAAQDIFVGRYNHAGDAVYYIMGETIKDTTPPSAHDYRSFEVSIKIVDNGEVQDILTYSYDEVTNKPWTHRLVKRMNGTVPPTVDDLLFPARNKVFEFSMDQLGWSYEIIDGHYY